MPCTHTDCLLRDNAEVEDHWVAAHAVQAVVIAPVPHEICSIADHVYTKVLVGSRTQCNMECIRPKTLDQSGTTHFQTMYHMSEKNRKLPRYRQVKPAKSCHTCKQQTAQSKSSCGQAHDQTFLGMISNTLLWCVLRTFWWMTVRKKSAGKHIPKLVQCHQRGRSTVAATTPGMSPQALTTMPHVPGQDS